MSFEVLDDVVGFRHFNVTVRIVEKWHLAFAAELHEVFAVGLVFGRVRAKEGRVIDVVFFQKCADFAAVGTFFENVEVEHGMVVSVWCLAGRFIIADCFFLRFSLRSWHKIFVLW